jgi:SAM-dependent methyltransferase
MVQATPYHRGEAVPDAELGAELVQCPLCGASGARRPVAALQTTPRVELWACSVCGGASASRIPTPEYLRGWYAHYYDGAERAVTFAGVDRFARHIAAKGPAVQPAMQILDFGSGDGAVALAVARLWLQSGARAVQVTLVDFHPAAVNTDPAITLVLTDRLETAAGDADLVIASAILEHLPDPEPALRQLVQALRPGGVFYARTPWVSAFLRVVPGMDAGYPGHLHDLGPSWWNRVGARLGLPVQALASQPSIVETEWSQARLRTLAAWTLKTPGWIEARLRRPDSPTRWWPFVAGWEVFWQRESGA